MVPFDIGDTFTVVISSIYTEVSFVTNLKQIHALHNFDVLP